VAFHGGRVDIERPRVRTPDGQQELELPSLAAGQREDGLGRWAMNRTRSPPPGAVARRIDSGM
jgi:putative transposase